MKYFPQEDEWQINETYMDNISKYPKDWYKQLTRRSKKKPLEEEVGEKSKSDKRRSSNQQVKSFTSATGRIGVPTAPKYGAKPIP